MADGRVLVALAQGPLVASPTWTRYDTLSGCPCTGFDIHRGRQSEFDVTETGTATVFFNDTNQTLNDSDLIGLQIQLQTYNPVNATWYPQYRGYIDDITYDVNPNGVISNVQIECVDLFDYLDGVKMVLGGTPASPTFGDPVPASKSNGTVFYEDGRVDDRIKALLTDAGLTSSWWAVFTGNVDVCETNYDSDSILSAIRDACDAEFPGIANCYIAKTQPLFQFHGRFARFDPVTVAASASGWDFNDWKAGDGAAIAGDSANAQIFEFSFNRPRSRIINYALAYPRTDELGNQFDEDNIRALSSTDSTSISTYGYRGWSAPDLIVLDNFNNSNTGADECALYASFYTSNYAVPRTNIQTLTVRSVGPGDDRAASTWGFISGVEISDRVTVTLGDAGISAEEYFVEGISMSVRVANELYDNVVVTPNLTPAAYYTTDVFNP